MRIVAFGMPALSPFSVAALRAARAAGDIHRASFRRRIRIDYKGPNDPVTEADRASEAAIVEILRSTFPDHAFLGEEGGRQGTGDYTWLIDPLDGTFNFAHAVPWFAVSIALERNGRPIVGVVLNTILGEVYAAEVDRGAFAAEVAGLPADPEGWGDLSHWRRLGVTETARLDRATLSTGFPHDVAETRINLDHFTNLLLGAAKIRNLGSAALSLAAIALGQTEGYWEIGPNAWDFAAGALLVEEAGGRVTDLRGGRLDLHGRQILATNGRIHEAVVAVLATGRSGLD